MEASALSPPAGLNRRSVASPLLRLRSDEQLVALFRAGNEDAFGVIHDRYRQRLFAYTRQMLSGSRSDAEDALQDVFLRAYRALRADERPVTLRAWLYRVAHNRCIDQIRRPVPEASDVYDVSRAPLQDPLAQAESREDLRRLVADVARLPEQQRSALLMREIDGMSYAELAAALDTSVPAIKSLLVRARVGLVEAIEARDTDCSDIRHDLASAYERGVRATGRARRHLRECSPCTQYRAQLLEVRRGFAALTPDAATPHLIAKLLGLGGAGSGAAAGGAAAGGGGAAVAGGAAAVSVGKVAAFVCCAAVVTGGAVEVKQIAQPAPERSAPAARPATAAKARAIPAATVRPARATTARTGTAAHDSGTALGAIAKKKAPAHRKARAAAPVAATVAPVAAVDLAGGTRAPAPPDPSGGALAPDEPAVAAATGTDAATSGSVVTASATDGTASATSDASSSAGTAASAGASAAATSDPAATTASAPPGITTTP